MGNALWEDIQSQSQNLYKVLDHIYGSEYSNLNAARSFLDNDKPILFIGMTSTAYLWCFPSRFRSHTDPGSGLYACRISRP